MLHVLGRRVAQSFHTCRDGLWQRSGLGGITGLPVGFRSDLGGPDHRDLLRRSSGHGCTFHGASGAIGERSHQVYTWVRPLEAGKLEHVLSPVCGVHGTAHPTLHHPAPRPTRSHLGPQSSHVGFQQRGRGRGPASSFGVSVGGAHRGVPGLSGGTFTAGADRWVQVPWHLRRMPDRDGCGGSACLPGLPSVRGDARRDLLGGCIGPRSPVGLLRVCGSRCGAAPMVRPTPCRLADPRASARDPTRPVERPSFGVAHFAPPCDDPR